jgi:iron complex outermembrane receptor protein
MNMSKFNKITKGIKIACLVGSAVGGVTANSAYAQESAIDNTEVIEVTGLRASAKKNLNEKRFSNAIVDAITAEDIGQFPDKNVAESLSRIPGITIDRTFGEGQGVTIRGVQADQNLTLLNGQAVGTAQWFVLSDATRNFNFEILASEMVAGLEVYKSSQADIDEGALGGTVILRTRKPMDLDANTMQFSTEAQYNDISEEIDPSFSGLYSWKNEYETFGVLASISYQERSVLRETNEDFGWFGPTIPRIEPALEAPLGATEKGALAWGMGSAQFQQKRERIGYNINAQWRPTENLDMNLNYLSSTLNADNVNSNLIGIGFRGLFAMGPGGANVGTVNNGIVESLEVRGVDNRPGWAQNFAYDNIFREGSEMSTEVIDFEGNYQLKTGSLHWQIGTTSGEGTNNDFFTEFWATPTDPRSAFDYSNPGGGSPAIDFSPSPWLSNPTDEMWLGGIFDQANITEDKENYAQIDYTHEVDLGMITEIKAGFKTRDRSFSQSRSRTDLANLAAYGPDGTLGPASDFWKGDTIDVSHSNTNAFAASYFFPDRDLMYDALYAVDECTATSGDSLCRNTDVFLTANSFEIEEDINAVYVMANFGGDGIRGNVGLRYIETDSTSNGFDLTTNQAVSFDSEYNEWLPSLNIAYDLDQETILRFAASSVLTRPAPFQLAPAVNLTPETSSGSAGNPDLNPLTANQFEVGVEHYFDEASIVAVTLFKKDINDFIFTKTIAKEINGVQINQLATPDNGGSTTIEGVEFQVQHVMDNGFGGYFNYTYTDVGDAIVEDAVTVSDADGNITGATLAERSVRFPNTSKNSYNMGVFYENNLYNARLNYNYRSEYFVAATEIGDQFRDEQAQMDAQFSYVLNENVTLKFEALNITNEIWENYYERNTDGYRLGGTQSSNGRRFYVGANFSF